MGYCTQTDLQAALADARMAELTAESGTDIETSVLGKVITSASSTIDRYLGGRYVVPVTDPTTLELLKPTCVALCKFQLYGRRDLDLDAKDSPPRVEYDEAMRWLRDVSKGDVPLPPSATRAAVPGQLSTDLDVRVGSEAVVFDPPSESEDDL